MQIIYTARNASAAPIGAEGYFSSDANYLQHAISSNEPMMLRELWRVEPNEPEPFIDTNCNRWACFYPLKEK